VLLLSALGDAVVAPANEVAPVTDKTPTSAPTTPRVRLTLEWNIVEPLPVGA
jgi:hypothetical protein